MPSIEEAFGVAYIEAMAAGIPAVGCAGEPGPEEIAAAGGGIELVAAALPGGTRATACARCSTTPTARAGPRRGRASDGRARVHLGALRRARRSPAYAEALR